MPLIKEMKNQKYFFIADVKTCRIFWGFEQLSSAIVGRDIPVQKLLDFSLSLPEQKVLSELISSLSWSHDTIFAESPNAFVCLFLSLCFFSHN